MVFTTGEVAERAGVKTDTVRYYEDRGLINEPPRTDSGYRQFPEGVVQTIRFIKEAQNLGFTLSEIQSLLSIRESEKDDCDEVRDLARDKQQSIQDKIEKLKRMEQTLDELIDRCERKGTYDYCPIIESLQPEGTGS